MLLTTLCINGLHKHAPPPPSELLHLNQTDIKDLISDLTDAHGGYVFEQRCWNRKEYLKALKIAGIEDFTFHDLRHCALNNLRLAGNDRYVIKKASGQETDSAFQRYILVTEDEMGGMKWLDQKKNSGTIDSYMDTYEQSINV